MKNKLEDLNYEDFEAVDNTLDGDSDGWELSVSGSIYHKDYKKYPSVQVFVAADVCGCVNCEGSWEEDGSPTYVPYGEGSVMLDDGKGSFEIESIDADVDIEHISFYTDENCSIEITEEEAFLDILKLSEDDAKELHLKIIAELSRTASEEVLSVFDEEYFEQKASEDY